MLNDKDQRDDDKDLQETKKTDTTVVLINCLPHSGRAAVEGIQKIIVLAVAQVMCGILMHNQRKQKQRANKDQNLVPTDTLIRKLSQKYILLNG